MFVVKRKSILSSQSSITLETLQKFARKEVSMQHVHEEAYVEDILKTA